MPKIDGLLGLQEAKTCFCGAGLALPASYADFNRDRIEVFESYADAFINRFLGMFEYKNLPETLDSEFIEKCLLMYGYAIITKVPEEYKGGGIYCLPGSYGGESNASLLPTTCTINSTWLRYSVSQQEIGKDCVLMRNDPFMVGIANLVARYCSQLADLEITLRMQAVSMRASHILVANDDTAKEDAEEYLRKLEEGKLGVIGSDALPEMLSFDTKEYAHSGISNIKDTLEAMQWLSAHLFIDMGLNDNYNMKREAINEAETDANADTLLPFVEQMLKYRKKGVEEINRLYGTNGEVDFAGAWKRVVKEEETRDKMQEAEAEIVEKQAEEKPSEEGEKDVAQSE